MKAVFEQVKAAAKQSILFRKIDLPAFDAPYHFHPEYELTYIVRGSGQRYVGMKAEEFRAGQLVFLGPNLPHCWLNTPDQDGKNVEAYVIQFSADVFQNNILRLPEFESLQSMFSVSSEGVLFDGSQDLEPTLLTMFESEPAQQLLLLIAFFMKLKTRKYHSILGYIPEHSHSVSRFQAVFSYIIANFKHKIELDKLAEIANISSTSFCRYFKQETGKTLFQMVLIYRLEAASMLLSHTQKRISEVAFESGFEDIPYFNRTFKKWKGMSPMLFRKTSNPQLSVVST